MTGVALPVETLQPPLSDAEFARFTRLAARLPRFRFSIGVSEGRILRVAFVILVTANWAYEIHRGV